MGAPILLGIIFFFIVCLGCADTIKTTVMVIAAFTLLAVAVRFNVLRDRIHWPFIALTLYVIMDGISTFYAVSGKFALREFLKVFLAYLLAVILMAISPKKEETTGKRIAMVLAICTALGSLISIDLISTRWISGIVIWILGRFTEAYEFLDDSVGRLNSLFSNSNVFGGFSGLGILISLSLADHAVSNKERRLFLVLLFINLLAFLLAINRGAFVFLFISLIVYVVLTNRSERFKLILLIIGSTVVSIACAVLVAKTSFRQWNSVQPIPILCVLLGAAVLIALDELFIKKISYRLDGHTKSASIATLCILLLIIAFGVAAFNITKDITLSSGESLIRIAFLRPGNYTLSVQTDGAPLNVIIGGQSQQEIQQNKYPTLYRGSAYDATFLVPEECAIVSFRFQAPEEIHIISASCNGNRIPLRYVLLPTFVVNRLQTPLVFRNLLQRLIYFQDGFKLFRRSPVIGLGMGAFENGIKSVQSYYYETKYAHNHYFQTMLETGIIGLVLFLYMLTVFVIAVMKTRKNHLYAPMLGALLAFMAGQALHDIVFSSYAYLPIAYGAFAVTDLCCGEAIRVPKLTKAIKTAFISIVSLCTVIYCFFLAGNILAKQQADRNPTFQTLVQSEKLDRFEWADYALPYVVNATGENINPYVLRQADTYAERLAKVDSNTIPIYLAEYYFSTARTEQGIAMVEKYVDYVASDPSAWQRAFDLLRSYYDTSETIQNAVVQLAQKMEKWNAVNAGSIMVNDDTQAFIAEQIEN